MQQFHCAHHKNASDCALIMDAMEFKTQSPRPDGIGLASCDSDFTGIGAACDKVQLGLVKLPYASGTKRGP